MKNFRVTLKSKGNVQDWYVRCESEHEAERLVVNMGGALAEPEVNVIDGNDGNVNGLELHPNRPVQYFAENAKL